MTRFKYIRKKINKGRYIPESISAVTLKMKPWKNLCVNCMKLYQKKLKFLESSDDDKNDGHTEKNPDCIGHEINRTIPSDSANLLGLSAIKPVGKQDRAGYGKKKLKKVSGFYNIACARDEKELLYNDSPECSKWSDLDL